MPDPRRRKAQKLTRLQAEERFNAPDNFEGNLRLVIAGGPDDDHGTSDEWKADSDE